MTEKPICVDCLGSGTRMDWRLRRPVLGPCLTCGGTTRRPRSCAEINEALALRRARREEGSRP